jgi:branched-chain amino acid transport system ATP-binding protein
MAGKSGGGAPLLAVRHVSLNFGGIAALQDISFDVAERTICGVIGPNGAGKTTLFNCLSRLVRPNAGSIVFDGHDLLDMEPHQIAQLGLARTFQHVALFPALSVRDNVMVGLHARSDAGFGACGLRLPRMRAEERELAERADAVLGELELTAHAERPVAQLPFPTRKRVELARALVSRPRMVLLDEPAAGLNHEEVGRLRETLLRIKTHWNAALLLVEHHMNLVMRCSDQVVALNFGCKIADGSPAAVASNADVVAAYLGGAAA